jgi:hypothetical protein
VGGGAEQVDDDDRPESEGEGSGKENGHINDVGEHDLIHSFLLPASRWRARRTTACATDREARQASAKLIELIKEFYFLLKTPTAVKHNANE